MRRPRAGGGACRLLLLSLLQLLQQAVVAADHCPRCPPPPALCSFEGTKSRDECFYKVDNHARQLIIATTGTYFDMKCQANESLDSASLPRLTSDESEVTAVSTVSLSGCWPPGGPYSAALRRRGVAAADRLLVQGLKLPELRADHFEGLGALSELSVWSAAPGSRAPPGLLRPLADLTRLTLNYVRLPAEALQQLPPRLQALSLRDAGLRELPAAALAGLPRLQQLQLSDSALQSVDLSAALALQVLVLRAPGLAALPPLPPALTNLTLESIKNVSLSGSCGALVSLTVSGRAPRALPPGWLQTARTLRRLELRLPGLRSLPGDALRGAAQLKALTLQGSRRLTALPADLLLHCPRLQELVLANNGLTALPDGIFRNLRELQRLDLTANKLVAAALQPLSDVSGSLQVLQLDRNPLGELCAQPSPHYYTNVESALAPLVRLRKVSLRRTGQASVCVDWRHALRDLIELGLDDNNITTLQWPELQWERAPQQPAQVSLRGNPLRSITLEHAQYAAAQRGDVTVELVLDPARPLRCDCHMYWFARALRDLRLRARLTGLMCQPLPHAAPQPLDRLDLEYMVCPLEGDDCPRNCSCELRAAGGGVLAVQCGNASLVSLPALPALLLRRELRPAPLHVSAPGNSIARLPAALPARLARLDLRRNAISEPDEAEVAALFADGRSVLLAGNPLGCACAGPLLRALPAHLAQLQDADAVQCADGRTLHAALREGCASLWAQWAAAALGAALLLGAGLLLCWRRNVRLRLKAALLARGLCLRWASPDDADDCLYDAFLSFSHHDADIAEQIRAELESGARPLRLCVHHRDWRAGDWIPAQIALSVAQSRRTVVLLSEHFVASQWARAEFREAHARALRDVTVRLVVVLLGAAPPPGLDPELQHYVTHNTYVRWGDPAFWDKLRVALPEGRPRPRPKKRATPAAPRATPATNKATAAAARVTPAAPCTAVAVRRKTKTARSATPATPAPPRATPVSPRATPAPPRTTPAPPRMTPAPPAPPRSGRRPPPLPPEPRVHPAPPGPAPPTPVIKFAQIDFPSPQKPLKNETSPCA